MEDQKQSYSIVTVIIGIIVSVFTMAFAVYLGNKWSK